MSPPQIVIWHAEQKDQQRWDAYVLRHPDASPYHLFAWKLAVEGAYGHRCHYLCAEINNTVVGVLPLVHLHLLGIVNELTALPYCDVGGCLSDNDAVQAALLANALRLQRALNCKKLQLRGPLRETGLKRTAFYREKTGKVRMLLDLPSTSDQLFSGFKSKLRSQVRKAEKNGVSFRWSGLEELDAIYAVFSRNMHDLGSPVHAKYWLGTVLRHYKNRARVGLAEFEGKAVGMGIILLGGQCVSIPWASTLREFNRLGPNMLLYWNCLKYSADNGYKIFDFGRSTENEGTYRFKKQWGAQPEPLSWYTRSASESGEVDRLAGQHSTRRGLAVTIWGRMPLSVVNVLGPVVRKYISL